ncbi:hypothetical protein CROQUDRAFT_658401 [Cronartium quercuum f. sp. fusiforme G11]|uniref:Uncharacterized protein n=1 Tax=Cronartium quercuum f. sp. fusiforme G11 TaxID=708437 RepID=A0A9P6NK16_9BASI|nr:hypothetical protein CROQUDRAFT_658401 [Cronartium quercuum f. sp. fusiforme G11]
MVIKGDSSANTLYKASSEISQSERLEEGALIDETKYSEPGTPPETSIGETKLEEAKDSRTFTSLPTSLKDDLPATKDQKNIQETETESGNFVFPHDSIVAPSEGKSKNLKEKLSKKGKKIKKKKNKGKISKEANSSAKITHFPDEEEINTKEKEQSRSSV